MKINIIPKSKLGMWSLILFIITIVLMIIFYSIIAIFNPQGTGSFFGVLELAIPLLLAWISSLSAFVLGILSIIKSKSKSILIFIVVIITALTTLFGVLEMSFPH